MESRRNVRSHRIRLGSYSHELAGSAVCERRISHHARPQVQPHLDGFRCIHDFGMGRRRRSRGSAVDAAAARKELGMSSFKEETRLIPVPARIIAAAAYVLCAIGFGLLFRYSTDAGLQSTPEIGKLLMIFGTGLMLAIYVLLIGYVNGDAKRRGM